MTKQEILGRAVNDAKGVPLAMQQIAIAKKSIEHGEYDDSKEWLDGAMHTLQKTQGKARSSLIRGEEVLGASGDSSWWKFALVGVVGIGAGYLAKKHKFLK